MTSPPWWVGPLGALLGFGATVALSVFPVVHSNPGILTVALLVLPALAGYVGRTLWGRSLRAALTSTGTVAGWLGFLALFLGRGPVLGEVSFFLTMGGPLSAGVALVLIHMGERSLERVATALGLPGHPETPVRRASRWWPGGVLLFVGGIGLLGLAAWAAETIPSCRASGPCMAPLLFTVWGLGLILVGSVLVGLGILRGE